MMIPLNNDFHSDLAFHSFHVLWLRLTGYKFCPCIPFPPPTSPIMNLWYSLIILVEGENKKKQQQHNKTTTTNQTEREKKKTDQKNLAAFSPLRMLGRVFWSLLLIDLRADVVQGVPISGVCHCCNVFVIFPHLFALTSCHYRMVLFRPCLGCSLACV